MSYEGYTQHLCKKGHTWTTDAYDKDDQMCFCGASVVWWNTVDVTNGSYDINPDTGKEERIDGYVELEITKETKCDHCNSVLEVLYKQPGDDNDKR